MSDSYRILLAIDLEEGMDRLLSEAQRYAQALNAVVDIIHVAPPDPLVGYIKEKPGELVDPGRQLQAAHFRAEHQQVHAVAERLRKCGINVDRGLMIQGTLPTALFEQVQKFNSDLLILGSHHHKALYRLWFGDTAIDAVRRLPCALLVFPI